MQEQHHDEAIRAASAATRAASATNTPPRPCAGALPQGRNSPQRAPLRPVRRADLGHRLHRAARTRTAARWLYRRQPSVVRGRYQPYRAAALARPAPTARSRCRPNRCAGTRCRSRRRRLDFVDGLRTMAANGDAEAQTGMAAHVYLANRSMERRAFVNADGEMLIVPQQGRLRDHHRAGRARGQARRDRAAAARRGVQGRAARRPVARLRLRELRRAVPPARARARSAPTAWPTRATSRRRWRPSKTRAATTSSSRSSAAACGARRSSTRRFNVVAWHGNLRREVRHRAAS